MAGGWEKATDKFTASFGAVFDKAGHSREAPKISARDACSQVVNRGFSYAGQLLVVSTEPSQSEGPCRLGKPRVKAPALPGKLECKPPVVEKRNTGTRLPAVVDSESATSQLFQTAA
jgi:hypothetical protein